MRKQDLDGRDKPGRNEDGPKNAAKAAPRVDISCPSLARRTG